ncbi:CHAP domain-containing protein [Candidatus Saccharibacteria bacterium]|nr:CHAP domain-containing protein [Candidatus Saccharibacteria bacterium]
MKIKNKHGKQILIFSLIIALITPIFLNLRPVIEDAQGISAEEICRRSPECQAAVQKKQEAERAAAAAARSANAYQAKVAELTLEITTKEFEIVETEAKIEDLTAEIRAAEAKLKSEQEALVELLVNMHFSSDAEPIQILAGASSISDLAEKAARDAVAKEQISLTAISVRTAKEALEFDKAEVEKLLAQQQQAREAMLAKKAEQEALIAKYENDAEAYNELAKAALKEQQAAIRAWQEAHPEYFSGSVYVGDNTYPWQGDCPHRQDDYITYWGDAKIGGYVCECVSYAGWKAYEAYGYSIGWGNAYSWDDNARKDSRVRAVNRTPAAGTIGQADGGQWGHVFWVESVNADGSINVTEYNNAYATKLYSGNYRYGDFGARTISAAEVGQYNYIHF